MSMVILGGIIVVLFITVVVLVVMLIAFRRKAGGDNGELIQLRTELEHLNQSVVEKEAQFNSRLNDKDEVCDKLLAEKDASCLKILAEKESAFRQKQEACDAALAEKDAACRELLAEKDVTCRKVLEEKDAALKQKEEACAVALAEKDAACQKILAEKDASLRQKDEACGTALIEKDAACKKVLAEKDLALKQKEDACTAALAEKEAACQKVLAEKDAAIKQKEVACNAALAEKDDACRKILLEKDATLKQKEEACTASLEAKDIACQKILAEKDATLKQKDDACSAALAAKDKACAETIAAKQAACNQIISEKNAALVQKEHDCRASLKDKDEAIARLIKEVEQKFGETVKGLQEKFGNIAATKMNEQQTNLSALNKVQMEQVVKPLHDQLHQLQLLTQQAQDGNVSLEKSMGEHIEAIGKIATGLSDVATKLTSNTRYQGRKGEEILAEKLRQAGLEENVNFFLQTGNDSDRPDAQVCDTENRWLIIDSKVSLTAYMEYMDAKDETVKAEKLQTHVTSVRQKIDQLAKKKYPKVFSEEHKDRNYLPITAMFVPYEAPLMAALQAEPSLWQFAAQNNVILITPLTLMAYLRLVYLAWQHEKEARNQQAIVDTARELLKRTNDFLKTFEELGGSMVQLQKVYEKSKGLLVDAAGAHTIAKSAKKLIDLHVKLESKKGKRIEKAECLKDIDEDDGLGQSRLRFCQVGADQSLDMK